MPALQPKVGKLCQIARGQTWVSPPFSVSKISELLGREIDTSAQSNCTFAFDVVHITDIGVNDTELCLVVFSEEEKQRLNTPENLWKFVQQLEENMNVSSRYAHLLFLAQPLLLSQQTHTLTIRDSELQRIARELFTEHMRKSLKRKPWIADLSKWTSIHHKRISTQA